jgi:hypothetical protein
MPLAAGGARGSALQEGAIRVMLVSAAVSLITAAVLIVWGLRSSRRADGRPKVP